MKLVLLKKKALILALVIVTLLIAVFGGGFAVKSAFTTEKRLLPIYSVKTDDKKIAISFDCAWGTDYTDTLLSIMEEENVKCTFFTVQFWTEKYPEYVKKISSKGHEIGTHSKTHSHMSKLSYEDIKAELTSSSQKITELTGKKVELFRPPFGEYNNLLISTAKELGLYTIQWSVDSLDWKNLSAQEITSRVLKGIDNGAIVLFHNNGLHTAKALPSIIKAVKAQGYEFVPIGDLIYKENYDIDTTGRQYLL